MHLRLPRAALMSGLTALCLAAGVTGPVAANTRDTFTIADVAQRVYSCGVVETTTITGRGIASFDTDGTWISTLIQFTFDGTFTDPSTGRTIHQTSRQVLSEKGGIVALRGQGLFLRLPGEGVVLLDVGRLVVDVNDGSTQFATPKALRIDDPDAGATADAAVCGMFS